MVETLLDKVGGMNFRGGQIPEDVYITLQGKTKPQKTGYNLMSNSYSDCDCIDCGDCDCNDCPVEPD